MLPGTESPSYGPRPICVPHISSTLFRLAIVVLIVVSVDLAKEDLPSVLNSSRWSHIVIRSQTLSIVSSHERASTSPVSSSLEVHSQSFMALSRSFFII